MSQGGGGSAWRGGAAIRCWTEGEIKTSWSQTLPDLHITSSVSAGAAAGGRRGARADGSRGLAGVGRTEDQEGGGIRTTDGGAEQTCCEVAFLAVAEPWMNRTEPTRNAWDRSPF